MSIIEVGGINFKAKKEEVEALNRKIMQLER